jgi:hypothetical protein
MKNKTDLIHRALRNLGALPQGQAPSAEEYQSLSDLVDAMVDELNKRNIIYLPRINSFDDGYLVALGHILAWRAAPEFGSADDASLAALAERAELDLREMVNNELQYLHTRTMRSDYPLIRTIATTSS